LNTPLPLGPVISQSFFFDFWAPPPCRSSGAPFSVFRPIMLTHCPPFPLLAEGWFLQLSSALFRATRPASPRSRDPSILLPIAARLCGYVEGLSWLSTAAACRPFLFASNCLRLSERNSSRRMGYWSNSFPALS